MVWILEFDLLEFVCDLLFGAWNFQSNNAPKFHKVQSGFL